MGSPENQPSAAELFARLDGLFETRVLSGRTVGIIGLGTGGSMCADELARAAVDAFILVDMDRLEVHNVARHTCGLSAVGRFKTHAVADQIKDVNPRASIATHEIDVTHDGDALTAIVDACDLVLVCTDNNRSRYAVNEACLRAGVAATYAGAYERAFGGFVMRVIPGETPCYDCVYGALQSSLGAPPRREGPIPYSEIEDPSEFKAEPGLAIDVHMIALIQAKMSLLTLLRGSESRLDDYPSDFVFWGNCAEWIFPEPLYSRFADTSKREDCPACLELSGDAADTAWAEETLRAAKRDPDAFDPSTRSVGQEPAE